MINLDIDNFIEVYVSVALEVIGKNREMPFSEFEEIVMGEVSKRIGISKEAVVYLHHPFHWTFFCGGDESPFRLIQPKKRGEVSKVGLNGRQVNKSSLVEYITEKYKEPYLTTKVG